MGKHLSLYSSHDSSLCFSPAPNEFRIYEFERLLKKRYCSLNEENDSTFIDAITYVKNFIESEYGKQSYESLFYGQLSPERLQMVKDIFGCDHTEEIPHHLAHAAGSLYQSDFEKALIISQDSGGFELAEFGVQTFCIFIGDKSKPMNHCIERLTNIPLDACGAYTLLAVPISDITKQDVYSKYLSYAGKKMALGAFGKIHQKWIRAFTAYYYRPVNLESLARLGTEIGLDFSTINTISGQTAFDVAATSQFVFEQVVTNAIMPFVERYQLPVILTGGGALNVLLNEKLRKNLAYPLFVPVNPNDCGLSFGMMCLRNPPTKQVNIMYSGFGILDIDKLPDYAERFKARKIHVRELARMLCAGKIIGVMRGNSECGPRALGNRSILAWPSAGMNDRLNEIKAREKWRPVAPVVRQDDLWCYFSPACVSPFMSYAPWVDNPYRDKLPAIVHKDGTARVQTVTEEQNAFMYELLSCVEIINDFGILINTSFNIKGKPILTTIEDAIEVWQTTDIDAVYIEGYLFENKH